jgi:hypothetical protein
MGESTVITGRSLGRRATLEIRGDLLTWRSTRNDLPDNVATTIHDTPELQVITRRWSVLGVVVAAFGTLWQLSEGGIPGIVAIVLGAALLARRLSRPTRTLAIGLGSRTLEMDIDRASLADARALVAQHAQAAAANQLGAGPERAPPRLP